MSFASSTMAALSAVPAALAAARPRPSDHDQRPQRTKEPPAVSVLPAPSCPAPAPAPASSSASPWDVRHGRIMRPRQPPHHTDLRPPRGCFKVTGSKGLSVRFAAEARCVILGDVVPPRPPRRRPPPPPPSRPPPPPPPPRPTDPDDADTHAPDPDKPPADRSVRWGPPLAPVPWKPR